MHNVIVEKPYKFVPPRNSRFCRKLIEWWLPSYLKKNHGIQSVEFRGAGMLRESLVAGHGILLAPNHCRPCDPMVLGQLAREVRSPFYVMASWHLFTQSYFQTLLLTRAGGFSVYREGTDREALKAAIEILATARRPLIIFPEGVITRTNERLNPMMDGPAFIARKAAKQRVSATPSGKVVVHPIAVRYHFRGDIQEALEPVLETIEERLTWRPRKTRSLIDRIYSIGEALLSLKEIEYLGEARPGPIPDRLGRLINHLLCPLEKEWLKTEQTGEVVARVKKLRTAILPGMIAGEISEVERARRWRQLADMEFAQQLSFYPPDYIRTRPSAERLLETVERFEEDLTGKATVHSPVHAVIQVGEVLEVKPSRDREGDGTGGSLLQSIRGSIDTMLQSSASEATLVTGLV